MPQLAYQTTKNMTKLQRQHIEFTVIMVGLLTTGTVTGNWITGGMGFVGLLFNLYYDPEKNEL